MKSENYTSNYQTQLEVGLMIKKNPHTEEIVIYNFNLQRQDLSLLFRGKYIPLHLREYKKLWRLYDKEKRVETIIISV